MKRLQLSLWQKLWLTISAVIVFTIIVLYGMTHYFYQSLYVDQVEDSLVQEGKSIAQDYTGGDITDELRKKIEWYNQISKSEILIVNDPKELSACLPFEMGHETIIGVEERERLINGEHIVKTGYEKKFDRNIMGVIVPLLDEKRLKGIVYLYIPLASVNDSFKEGGVMLAVACLLFGLFIILIGRQMIKKLTKPLHEMERVAYHMSKGDYSEKVTITSNDEVGRLGVAFNRMSEAIKEEDERRREFLGNVSHELRTPISYIKGYSEAILDGTVKGPDESKKYLQLIHREAGRMQRLVRDLLELAQLEGKSIPLEQQPLVLAQLMEEALEKFCPFLQENEITLNKKLDPDIIIMGDQDRIEQIIQNIMDNAIRYSPKASSIEVSLEKAKGNSCLLSIRDHGPGIPKDVIHRIGERFFRVDKSRSRQCGGTGLGMAIVKKIIQLHNGKLQIESEQGEGTTVLITLPMLDD